jgi:hypothetical protein
MLGIVEVISLLLGLSGVGLHPNPKPPTPEAALAYAVPDADVVLHVDAATIIPGNYKVLVDLPSSPAVKSSPELGKAVRELVANVEGGRGIVKTTTGIDLATDLSDATAFIQIVPGGQPTGLVAVHGKFTPTVIDRIAKLGNGAAQKIGGGSLADVDAKLAVALTQDGVLLAGTPQLVKDRLGDGWKAPAHGAGTNLGYAAETIGNHPVFAMVVSLQERARKAAVAELGKNFATDLIERNKAWAFAAYSDGIGWTWVDSSRAGLESMSQISDGMIDLMRAAQFAPRGVAKIIVGSLDSYKGNKTVDELIRHKDDLLKIVNNFTGDGQFKVTKTADAAKLRLDVRATGKNLSDVLPAIVVVPFVAGFVVAGREMRTEPMQIPAPKTR